ncbi:MAG: N-acetylneuraminate synthase [Candidatus Koribacter versatilis]|uniref:N-acetylneuraminate synthase n=1 Tax=Candidatus Korobacter versatilis TaxID=658062 RepID=A0A932A6M1_9BACT|nr:N-acetylneuraminate synthase [Candidatus Koribacter versatilis]
MQLAGRTIAEGAPCFVIAEAGVNHNGSLATARQLADAAKSAGADAVKYQTFRAEKVVSPAAPKAAYQQRTTGAAESQLDMVRKLALPIAAFAELNEHCRKLGILFLSTPADEESIYDLANLGVPAFKIASGEVTNFPFLEHVARTGKPVILSTGMSDLEEVRLAVQTLRAAGNRELVLLHCVSNYPADPASANLRAMHTLRDEFSVPIGYSDHTLGASVALAAAALGACVIEKHLTLDNRLPGPDHQASLDPKDFAEMVRGIRAVEAALGDGRKRRMPEEEDVARVARRSLVAACDIPAGATIASQHIAILRPGTGMPPAERKRILGKRVLRDVSAGTLLSPEMFA